MGKANKPMARPANNRMDRGKSSSRVSECQKPAENGENAGDSTNIWNKDGSPFRDMDGCDMRSVHRDVGAGFRRRRYPPSASPAEPARCAMIRSSGTTNAAKYPQPAPAIRTRHSPAKPSPTPDRTPRPNRPLHRRPDQRTTRTSSGTTKRAISPPAPLSNTAQSASLPSAERSPQSLLVPPPTNGQTGNDAHIIWDTNPNPSRSAASGAAPIVIQPDTAQPNQVTVDLVTPAQRDAHIIWDDNHTPASTTGSSIASSGEQPVCREFNQDH